MRVYNFIFWAQRHSFSPLKLPWVLKVPIIVMKDTSSTGHGHCKCSSVYLPPMAVPEPLVRKQLLQNTVPETEEGQQVEKVWVFSYRCFWNAAWVLLQKMSQSKGQPGRAGITRDCCEKNMGGRGRICSVLLSVEAVSWVCGCFPGEYVVVSPCLEPTPEGDPRLDKGGRTVNSLKLCPRSKTTQNILQRYKFRYGSIWSAQINTI